MLAELNQKILGLTTPYQPCARESLPEIPTTHFPATGNATVDKWQKLYESPNLDIRVRAATALIAQADTPLTLLLSILDQLWHQGLVSSLEKAFLKRRGKDMVEAMLVRLNSPERYLREFDCTVLGNSQDFAATPRLLRMLDDPQLMVRRAAALAIGSLKDVSAIPVLQRELAARQSDDSNVIFALKYALHELGSS
jgi:HEAT repeat protein